MRVESRKLSDVLRASHAGDMDSIEAILARFMPMFMGRSSIGGKIDEDFLQYLLMRVIKVLPKFDPDKVK
jgi:hypothetical protein